MKAIVFGLAALGAQLGHAVPHGDNQHHRLHVRQEVTDYSMVTDVVTVTAPNAVIWVDQYNNIISTEYRDLATPTATASNIVVPAVSHLTSTSSNVPASSTQFTSPTYVSTSAPSIVSSNYVSSNWASSLSISSASSASSTTSSAGTGADKLSQHNDTTSAEFNGFGICYELIGNSGCKDPDSLNSDFAALASQGYTKIRTYDIGCNLGTAATAAAAQGLQLIIGLNGIGNVVNDITTLVGMINGNWDPIDTVVVGNEVVNNGGDPGAVVAAIAAARPILSAAGFSKNVVTVDTFDAHELHPELCQASDYCAANAHAFFDPNTAAPAAGSFVTAAAAAVARISNGKKVIITESGWPWQGSPNGLAVPSLANQQIAINSLNTAFSGNPGGLFLFQAYDATYKAPGPLGVEQFFGIYGH